jgi:uncharacterized protein
MIYCIYHRADNDGLCSGSIVKHALPEAQLVGMNYNEEFPLWDKLSKDDVVIMTDFSLEPFEEMIRLNELCELHWIDHHDTAIKKYEESGADIKGLRVDGTAACTLTWEYFFNEPAPKAVEFIGLYDVWDHRNPQVLPFQMGLRTFDTRMGSRIWDEVIRSDPHWIAVVVSKGAIIMDYQKRYHKGYCSAYSFETEFEGLKALAVNKGFTNSMVFGDRIRDYDIVITFVRKNKAWKVSFYTDKEHVHCGQLAEKYGGGGHRQAAGANVEELPFEY